MEIPRTPSMTQIIKEPELRINFENKELPDSIFLTEINKRLSDFGPPKSRYLNQFIDVQELDATLVISGSVLFILKRQMYRELATCIANKKPPGFLEKQSSEICSEIIFPEKLDRMFLSESKKSILIITEKSKVYRVDLEVVEKRGENAIKTFKINTDDKLKKAVEIDGEHLLVLTSSDKLLLVGENVVSFMGNCSMFHYSQITDKVYMSKNRSITTLNDFRKKNFHKNETIFVGYFQQEVALVPFINEHAGRLFIISQEASEGDKADNFELFVLHSTGIQVSKEFFTVDTFAGEECTANSAEFEMGYDDASDMYFFWSNISASFRVGEVDGSKSFRLLDIDESQVPTVGNDANENPGFVKGMFVFNNCLFNANELTKKKYHSMLKNENEEPLCIFWGPRICMVDNLGRVLFRGIEDFRKGRLANQSKSKLKTDNYPIFCKNLNQLMIRGDIQKQEGGNSDNLQIKIKKNASVNIENVQVKTIDKFASQGIVKPLIDEGIDLFKNGDKISNQQLIPSVKSETLTQPKIHFEKTSELGNEQEIKMEKKDSYALQNIDSFKGSPNKFISGSNMFNNKQTFQTISSATDNGWPVIKNNNKTEVKLVPAFNVADSNVQKSTGFLKPLAKKEDQFYNMGQQKSINLNTSQKSESLFSINDNSLNSASKKTIEQKSEQPENIVLKSSNELKTYFLLNMPTVAVDIAKQISKTEIDCNYFEEFVKENRKEDLLDKIASTEQMLATLKSLNNICKYQILAENSEKDLQNFEKKSLAVQIKLEQEKLKLKLDLLKRYFRKMGDVRAAVQTSGPLHSLVDFLPFQKKIVARPAVCLLDAKAFLKSLCDENEELSKHQASIFEESRNKTTFKINLQTQKKEIKEEKSILVNKTSASKNSEQFANLINEIEQTKQKIETLSRNLVFSNKIPKKKKTMDKKTKNLKNNFAINFTNFDKNSNDNNGSVSSSESDSDFLQKLKNTFSFRNMVKISLENGPDLEQKKQEKTIQFTQKNLNLKECNFSNENRTNATEIVSKFDKKESLLVNKNEGKINFMVSEKSRETEIKNLLASKASVATDELIKNQFFGNKDGVFNSLIKGLKKENYKTVEKIEPKKSEEIKNNSEIPNHSGNNLIFKKDDLKTNQVDHLLPKLDKNHQPVFFKNSITKNTNVLEASKPEENCPIETNISTFKIDFTKNNSFANKNIISPDKSVPISKDFNNFKFSSKSNSINHKLENKLDTQNNSPTKDNLPQISSPTFSFAGDQSSNVFQNSPSIKNMSEKINVPDFKQPPEKSNEINTEKLENKIIKHGIVVKEVPVIIVQPIIRKKKKLKNLLRDSFEENPDSNFNTENHNVFYLESSNKYDQLAGKKKEEKKEQIIKIEEKKDIGKTIGEKSKEEIEKKKEIKPKEKEPIENNMVNVSQKFMGLRYNEKAVKEIPDVKKTEVEGNFIQKTASNLFNKSSAPTSEFKNQETISKFKPLLINEAQEIQTKEALLSVPPLQTPINTKFEIPKIENQNKAKYTNDENDYFFGGKRLKDVPANEKLGTDLENKTNDTKMNEVNSVPKPDNISFGVNLELNANSPLFDTKNDPQASQSGITKLFAPDELQLKTAIVFKKRKTSDEEKQAQEIPSEIIKNPESTHKIEEPCMPDTLTSPLIPKTNNQNEGFFNKSSTEGQSNVNRFPATVSSEVSSSKPSTLFPITNMPKIQTELKSVIKNPISFQNAFGGNPLRNQNKPELIVQNQPGQPTNPANLFSGQQILKPVFQNSFAKNQSPIFGQNQANMFGQPSFGQPSFGQLSFGQSSFGQTSFGQSSFGNNPVNIPSNEPYKAPLFGGGSSNLTVNPLTNILGGNQNFLAQQPVPQQSGFANTFANQPNLFRNQPAQGNPTMNVPNAMMMTRKTKDI